MNVGASLYRISVDGHLGATAMSAFPSLVAQHQAAQTVLTGFLDRSALYGVLAHLEMLGLDLAEVHRVRPPDPRPTGGGSTA